MFVLIYSVHSDLPIPGHNRSCTCVFILVYVSRLFTNVHIKMYVFIHLVHYIFGIQIYLDPGMLLRACMYVCIHFDARMCPKYIYIYMSVSRCTYTYSYIWASHFNRTSDLPSTCIYQYVHTCIHIFWSNQIYLVRFTQFEGYDTDTYIYVCRVCAMRVCVHDNAYQIISLHYRIYMYVCMYIYMYIHIFVYIVRNNMYIPVCI